MIRARLQDAIRTASDPFALMNRIVSQALVLVPGADGASFEVRPDAENLEYVCAAGELAPHIGLRLPVHASLSGLALLTGDITHTSDALKDPRANAAAVVATRIRSMLCVPVHRDGAGAVLKVSSQHPHAFRDEDVEILQHLAKFMDATLSAASQVANVTADLLAELDGGPSADDPAAPSAVARFVANVMTPGLLDVIESSERIEEVLESRQIEMVIQPIIELSTGDVVAVEALARFPGDVQRPADRWFADARAAGHQVDLEMLAVESALDLIDQLPADVHLAVNVGPATLLDERLAVALQNAPRQRITIELTEHEDFIDYPTLISVTRRLRSTGVRLSIDDTGSGYSGLSHILKLRPDILKIDRDLTDGIDADLVRQSLATALVSFSAGLQAHLIAEGIETPEALDALVGLGVRYGQGFYLGRPAPVAEVFSR